MNKIFTFIFMLVLVTGCNFTSGSKTEDAKPQSKFNVGNMVVAQWSPNSFYEGEIESISGSKVRVKWSDGSDPSDVDLPDVYAVPNARAAPEVKPGDKVLAKTGNTTYWNGAEITKIGDGVFTVKTVEDSATATVPPDKIIMISAATAASFANKSKSTNFESEAYAKNPTVPPGFKPASGDKVLAEWSTNSWYSGKVQAATGSMVTVAWDDGTPPKPVELKKVLPLPTADDTAMPEKGQYVLVKPVTGSAWEYAQAIKVSGEKVEIKTSDDGTRSLKAGEFVLLK